MKAKRLGFNPEYCEEAPNVRLLAELAGNSLLEFGAPWCGHCQAAQQPIEEALTERPQLPHIKIYDAKGNVLGRRFKVTLWPTLILLDNGEEVARLVRPQVASDITRLLAS